MKARPYQIEYIEASRNLLAKNKRIISVLPTGGGKTVIFSIIAQLVSAKGKKVVILTNRTELCKQAKSKGLETAQIIDDKTTKIYTAPVTIAMVQSLYNRIKAGKVPFTPDLIIIDECHYSDFFKILDIWSDVLTIGFTATPINKKLHLYYSEIYQKTDVGFLIQNNFLCKSVAKMITKADFSELEKSKLGDFTDASNFKAFNKKVVYENVLETFLNNRRKTIIFCVNVKDCYNTLEIFESAGIKCSLVHSPSEDRPFTRNREQEIQAFSKGYTEVMINCGILTTGYDEPTIRNVFIKRATDSLALFMQMCGRGSRPIIGEKDTFYIFDFGGNHTRLSTYWEEERVWELKPPKKKKQKAPPFKECPACQALLHISAQSCFDCGHSFEKKKTKIDYSKTTWVDVTKGISKKDLKNKTTAEIIELAEKKQIKHHFAVRNIYEKEGRKGLETFAQQKGYKSGWTDNIIKNFKK